MTERFELLEQIGKGGMGTVWRARDRYSRQIVALKLLHPALAEDPYHLARLEREVEVARRIDNLNVVRVLGYGQQDGTPYIAMEYVEGKSLRDLILEGRTKDFSEWGQAKSVLRQLANALDAAHRAGVIHRDIKPANVMIDERGNVKLADFGIAKAMDMSRLTGGLTILGTPAYMAPDLEVTEQSDLYAVGCVIYEMVTGAPPFEGATQQKVLLQHLRDAPDLAKIPENLRDTVRWLLEKEPGKRPKSAAELLQSLLPTGAFAPVSEAAGVAGEQRQRSREWRLLWPALGVLVLLSAAGTGVYLWRLSTREVEERPLVLVSRTPTAGAVIAAPPPGPPVVEEFQVSPEIAIAGETVIVSLRFSDPDGDASLLVTRYVGGTPWKFGSKLETPLNIPRYDQWNGEARAEVRFECVDFYNTELEFTVVDSAGGASAPQLAMFGCRVGQPETATAVPAVEESTPAGGSPTPVPQDTIRITGISHTSVPRSAVTPFEATTHFELHSANSGDWVLALRLFPEPGCRGEPTNTGLLGGPVEPGTSERTNGYPIGPFPAGVLSVAALSTLTRNGATIAAQSTCITVVD